jgi:hypothetical protein
LFCEFGTSLVIYLSTNKQTKTKNNSNKLKTKKMKNIIKAIAATVVIAGFATSSFAQATATASASANIITPISIVKNIDMNFGNVAVSGSLAGTVVLSPAGGRTTGGGGGVTLPSTIGTVAAANFTVSGQASYTYAITLPGSCVITDGTNNMTVNAFTSTPSSTGTLSSGGVQTLTVGATLNVSAGQHANAYTNATGVPVIVNYN